ncbi:histone-fold-containing protein, partial [Neoconidiobolus thromboides FSU 785]
KKYKTKFPVSRIKKIMQTDEDVGKMTSNTPVVISAALELFIKSITYKACEEAKKRKASRISLSHLKRAIMSIEQFDFLKDLVATVPD